MLDMCPCCASEQQSGSDRGWKSSKTSDFFRNKALFRTSLEQMFQSTVTDLNK